MNPYSKNPSRGDHNWINRNAKNWTKKKHGNRMDSVRAYVNQEFTLADTLKAAYNILNRATKISREGFAKQYRQGGIQRINELVELFTSDPDLGTTFRPDAKQTNERQKAMLDLFEDAV